MKIKGIKLASVAAGIRYPERDDLVLIELPDTATTAAVFTQNSFCAAPVMVAKEHLDATSPRYLLINSGNANAGTGDTGLRAARETCKLVAAASGCALNQVLPFSTGVIGEDLPLDPFATAMPQLLSGLAEDHWLPAAKAIMTTDTRPKLFSRTIELAGEVITITGMSKGSGMIHPNMATMLAYVATDARVSASLLQEVLQQAVAPSFNAITVDGDTSTNDACVLIASGQSAVEIKNLTDANGMLFSAAVREVCMDLARAIILDGEGATKLVTIEVQQAATEQQAKDVAFTVAHSPLVKTALFASDPNWGRILAAVGRAGVDNLNINGVCIWLDDVCIARDGGRDAAYTEQAGQQVMNQDEISIKISLANGDKSARVLTCDLSYDYVKINAEYRS